MKSRVNDVFCPTGPAMLTPEQLASLNFAYGEPEETCSPAFARHRPRRPSLENYDRQYSWLDHAGWPRLYPEKELPF